MFEASAILEGHTEAVSCAMFSPFGGMIITGGFDHQLLMWDGETGDFLETVDEDMGAAISTLSFSPEGDQLLASSQSVDTGTTAIYDLESREQLVTFPMHDNSVFASAWHPERNLVATGGGGDDEVYLWYPADDVDAGVEAGAIMHYILGRGLSAWSVAFSEDEDLVVAFGQSRDPEKEMLENDLEQVFDFKIFDLVEGSTFQQTLTDFDGCLLESLDFDNLRVGELGVITNDDSDGSLLSYSYTPDGSHIVVGSDYSLKSFESEPDDDGTFAVAIDFIGHESAVNALSPSLDGRYLATASGDKTVRLWNLETGALLASLFVTYDGEWVCWTPSGHYQASSGGEQYIGWHFNKGPDKMGEFYPSSVFRDTFHHPELVRRTIQLGDFEKALLEVGVNSVDLTSVLPPNIELFLPSGKTVIQSGNEVTVKAKISSPNGELRRLKLLLNGKAIQTYDLTGKNDFSYEESVTLNPGENRLSLFVRNEHAGQKSAEWIINIKELSAEHESPDTVAPGLAELLKPNLYVLAVGVSEFASAGIPALSYCDDDAIAIADFFTQQEGGLFAKTEVKLLTNVDATEANIQTGLDWLEKSATQKDFVVLFLAAHGLNDDKGNFYMIPHDCDPENLRSTAVAWEDFGAILGNLPSRVLMFLDTCHSGRLGANLFSMAKGGAGGKTRSIGGLTSAFDNTEAIRELTSDEVGVVIMAASTGSESSLENPEWGHGAFTAGVLAGLKGEADLNKDGIVHLLELDFFVSERVKELSKGEQHPTTVKPSTISRLPVSAVIE